MNAWLTEIRVGTKRCFGLSTKKSLEAAMSDAEKEHAKGFRTGSTSATQIPFQALSPEKPVFVLQTMPSPIMPMLIEDDAGGNEPGYFIAFARCESFGRSSNAVLVIKADGADEARKAVQDSTRQWTKRPFLGCIIKRIEANMPYAAIAETR